MIKATQGNSSKGNRDLSPKASNEDLENAEDATTKHDAPNSKVTKESPKASKKSVDDMCQISK